MSRQENLQRRLAIAVREAEDADRIWRTTMEIGVSAWDERELMLAARRLHAVWQEREFAHGRVGDLERLVAGGGGRRRLDRMQAGRSFLAWHARRRLERTATPS